MADLIDKANDVIPLILEISMFLLLAVIILQILIVSNWKTTYELDILILALISYTLLLVLPISDFDLSLTGLKARIFRRKLDELTTEAPVSSVSLKSTKITSAEKVCEGGYSSFSPGIVFLRYITDIQKTLDEIAQSVEIPTGKNSLGTLIAKLKEKGVLTDPWLLKSLYFLRDNRNDVLHSRKTNDLERAITLEQTVIGALKAIKSQLEEKKP
jgi:hypothetical protein